MVAFILAAGYGTRLLPLTEHTPKALIRVGGVPMLEHVARRCIDAGADRVVVNVSHLSERVVEFLQESGGFGVPCDVSDEPGEPLETGGGIKKAAHLLPADEAVLIHNVDVLTNIDLRRLVEAHRGALPQPLATLAVAPPETDRYLLFDTTGLLGYARVGEETLMRRPSGEPMRFDYCGVQVLSAGMVEHIRAQPEERFSVMDLYLRLAREGAAIVPFEGAGHRCLDVGTHERLAEADAMLEAFVS